LKKTNGQEYRTFLLEDALLPMNKDLSLLSIEGQWLCWNSEIQSCEIEESLLYGKVKDYS